MNTRHKLRITLVALLMASIAACSDEPGARRALEAAGYSDISLDGYAFTGCGDDSFHTKFVAKGPTGKTITGVVCGGVLKGSTIRLD